MRFGARVVAPVLVLAIVLAAAWHRLVAAPGSLLVNGQQASIDRACPPHLRGLGNDLTSVFLPRFMYVVRQLRASGHVPAWDATGFGGRPLVGNPQAGWCYPPMWVAWHIGKPAALGWLTAAHLLWAGLGTFALIRRLGFSCPSALLAGACYEVSPYLTAHAFEGHYPHVWSACWYPWAFWAWVLCLRRDPLGYWALPAVLGLTFLTGHPQEWYYLVVVLSLAAIAVGIRRSRVEGARKGLAPVVVWVAALGLSFGWSAMELLPQTAAGQWTLRAGTLPLEQINRYRLHTSNLLQLLSPAALGGPHDYLGDDNYWETVFSIGLIPLILAIAGGSWQRESWNLRPWLLLIGGTAAFAAGKQLGLYSLAYAVLPGLDRFRVPARTLFLANLGASVLIGAGWERVFRASARPATWTLATSRFGRVLLGVASLALVAMMAGAALRTDRPVASIEPSAHRILSNLAESPALWIGVLGAAGAMAVAGLGGRWRTRAAWGLGALAVLELVYSAQAILVVAPASEFLENDRLGVAIIEGDRPERGPLRIATFGTLYPDLRAAALGLEKTNINDSFQIQHAADLYQRLYPILDPARPRKPLDGAMDHVVDEYRAVVAQTVMNVMGVRRVATDRPLSLPGLEPSATVGAIDVLENRGALPMAYVVPSAVPLRRAQDGKRTRLDEFDPKHEVVMIHDPLEGMTGDRQPFTPADWRSNDPDHVRLSVDIEAPGLLVVGMTWMPGWSATVDGAAVVVERGNHWQQVVPITTTGHHEIELRYVPPGLATGTALSGMAALGWVVWGLGLAFQKLRPSRVACAGTIRA
jgi:Bacterial membrane protein YfhO